MFCTRDADPSRGLSTPRPSKVAQQVRASALSNLLCKYQNDRWNPRFYNYNLTSLILFEYL